MRSVLPRAHIAFGSAACLAACGRVAVLSAPAGASPAVYDPAAAARASGRTAVNPWATIPPHCWTPTTPEANPCWCCHAPALPPNELADRSAEVASISDAEFSARFLPGGVRAVAELRRAAPVGDRDPAWLLAPSRERVTELAEAYLVLVPR